MSFANTKIQEFNDIIECTPSPRKCNVQTQEKVKSGVIPQLENCSESETGSVHSTPVFVFQTPSAPNKENLLEELTNWVDKLKNTFKQEKKINEERETQMDILRKRFEEAKLKLSESEARVQQLERGFTILKHSLLIECEQKLALAETFWKSQLDEKEKERNIFYDDLISRLKIESNLKLRENEAKIKQLEEKEREQKLLYDDLIANYNILDTKFSETFEKNRQLEAANSKLNKLIKKMVKAFEDE